VKEKKEEDIYSFFMQISHLIKSLCFCRLIDSYWTTDQRLG